MMHRFKVVVPSFNSLNYLPKTLRSIEEQTDKAFDVCVIDDCSTVKGQQELIESFCQRNHWHYLANDKNYGALYGIVHALPLMGCQDEDVVVILDGDDWFASVDALSYIRDIYAKKDIYLTWGQCEVFPAGKTPMKYAQPIPEMVIKQKLYRDIPYVFWHPTTFKYLLWRHIQDSDLRDVNGKYFKLFKDKAIMFPMLEMAGDKIHFIDKTLVIYNLENPLNDYATSPRDEFERVDKFIKSKKRYETLLLA